MKFKIPDPEIEEPWVVRSIDPLHFNKGMTSYSNTLSIVQLGPGLQSQVWQAFAGTSAIHASCCSWTRHVAAGLNMLLLISFTVGPDLSCIVAPGVALQHGATCTARKTTSFTLQTWNASAYVVKYHYSANNMFPFWTQLANWNSSSENQDGWWINAIQCDGLLFDTVAQQGFCSWEAH